MPPLWMIPILLVLLLLFAAAGAWLVRRARRKPAPRTKSRRSQAPRLPVVLAHGLFGFDELRLGKRRLEYFKNVPRKLRKMGAEIHVARVAFVGGVETRAAQLAERIRDIDGGKVNVIAHSLGGIDARYAISKLGLANKVASLTTIGTPHRGTPLADAGGMLLPFPGIAAVRTSDMKKFNLRVPDVRGVHYASCVAQVEGGVGAVSPLLVPSWLYLRMHGANDGIVPGDSQAWGEVLAEVDADHWAQVGWSKGFDAPAFYAGLLRELRGRGF